MELPSPLSFPSWWPFMEGIVIFTVEPFRVIVVVTDALAQQPCRQASTCMAAIPKASSGPADRMTIREFDRARKSIVLRRSHSALMMRNLRTPYLRAESPPGARSEVGRVADQLPPNRRPAGEAMEVPE
jgi:hypothetical protein